MTPAIDVTKTKSVLELKYASALISSRFDPSGKYIFASAQDFTIQRWEIATSKAVPFAGHTSWVRGLTCDKATKTLWTSSYAGEVFSWDIESEKPAPKVKIDAHRGWARAVALSTDGKTLATCGNDKLVRLWSATDGKKLAEYEGHACHVYNVGFHPDGKHLVSADLKGVVKVWELATGKSVREMDASVLYKYDTGFKADIGGVRSMAFNADGSLLACSGITEVSNAFAGVGKPLVVLFDWKTGQRKQLLKPKTAFQGTAWGVGFHSSGIVVGVGGGSGGALWFWKTDAAESFFDLKLQNNARDLDLHPDQKRLAVASHDGVLRLYEMG